MTFLSIIYLIPSLKTPRRVKEVKTTIEHIQRPSFHLQLTVTHIIQEPAVQQLGIVSGLDIDI
jgi:hypothetical protein